MSIVISQTTSVVKQGNVDFTCPKCEAEGTGTCSKIDYLGKLFFCIPIFKSTVTQLRCSSCASEFRSNLDFDVVLASSREKIAQALSPSVSFVTKALTVVGFVLILVPIANIVAFGVAFLAAFKSSSKWRMAALIGAILSVMWTIAFFALAANGS